MSKEVLSQGEIDALLKTIEISGGEHFTDTEKEALIELTNLSLEAATAALSALTNREIETERPEISLGRRNIIDKKVAPGAVCQTVLYEGTATGQGLVAVDGGLAAVLCDILLGGDGSNPPADLGETQLNTLREAFQNGLEGAATALSEALAEKIKMTAGAINVAGPGHEEVAYFADFDPDHIFADLEGRLSLPDLVEGSIKLLYPKDLARALLQRLTAQQEGAEGEDGGEGEEAQTPAAEFPEPELPAPDEGGAGAEAGAESEPEEPRPRAKAQPPKAKAPNRVVGAAGGRVQVQPAKFESLKPAASRAEPQNLDLIMDVPLHLTVELGRTKMQVRQILALGTGAVIELEKLAGEPLDVMINGRLIAKGEVVIINENFGVRITDIVSQVERVQNLR